jgi:hypothetical protein
MASVDDCRDDDGREQEDDPGDEDRRDGFG